jgi:hypothetical protein
MRFSARTMATWTNTRGIATPAQVKVFVYNQQVTDSQKAVADKISTQKL